MSIHTKARTTVSIDAIIAEYIEKVAVLRKMAKDVMQFLPSDIYGLSISRQALELRDKIDDLADDVEANGYVVVQQMVDDWPRP